MPGSNDKKARTVVTVNYEFETKHQTYDLKLDRLYTVWNPNARPSFNGLKSTTAEIQRLIKGAIDDKRQIRGLGGNWSMSRVAAARGAIIDTKPLKWVFRFGDASTNISPNYTGDRGQLLLAQCGVQIANLNPFLKRYRRALKTTGASNGQTIVGAMSTGTHGSRFAFGAVQESIVGMHLIVGPDKHLWVERATYPVVSDAFTRRLGATYTPDDKLFNAALVSFGSFGIIHAVMIETEPVYLLDKFNERIAYNAEFKAAIKTGDFAALPLRNQPEIPYHLEIVANPFEMDEVYVRTMYQRPYTPYDPPVRDKDGFGPGDALTAIAANLSKAVPAVIPKIIKQQLEKRYKTNKEPITGTIGDIFTNTTSRGKTVGSAMGVPLEHAIEAFDLAIKIQQDKGPFPAVVAARFVKKSGALLAFTRYNTTCVIDLDGADSDGIRKYYDLVWKAFDEADFPFTMHWGKINTNLTPQLVKKMYSTDVDTWIDQRKQVLDAASREVFNNEFVARCGLDG